MSKSLSARAHRPRPRANRILGAALAALLTFAASLSAAASAQAATIETDSPSWAGVIGKPTILGSDPVDDVSMDFIVPVLDCKTARNGWVSIWIGMDSVANSGTGFKPNVTQNGLMGRCINGVPQWYGWYQAHPDFESTPMPGMPPLQAGQHVWMELIFEPWRSPAADTFDAVFSVYNSDGTYSGTYQQLFETSAGAAQRARAECIVERPSINKVTATLPKFTMADGSDFTANQCIGGTHAYRWYLDGRSYTNILLEDMYDYQTKYESGQPYVVLGKKVVDARVDPGTGKVSWKWLRSK